MSQLLLTYFKQLHGEQSFSDIFFRMPLLTDAKLNLNDILQKDIVINNNDTQFREKYNNKLLFSLKLFYLLNSLTTIKNDLGFSTSCNSIADN